MEDKVGPYAGGVGVHGIFRVHFLPLRRLRIKAVGGVAAPLSAFRAAAINFVAITAAAFLCRRPVAVPRALEAFGVTHHLLPVAPLQLISWR